jgi:hypothetical protein
MSSSAGLLSGHGGVEAFEAHMERGGGVAQVASSHDRFLLEVKLDEVAYSNAVGVPGPESKVFIPSKVFNRLADRNLNRIFAKLRENSLAPDGNFRITKGATFSRSRVCVV